MRHLGYLLSAHWSLSINRFQIFFLSQQWHIFFPNDIQRFSTVALVPVVLNRNTRNIIKFQPEKNLHTLQIHSEFDHQLFGCLFLGFFLCVCVLGLVRWRFFFLFVLCIVNGLLSIIIFLVEFFVGCVLFCHLRGRPTLRKFIFDEH